MSIFVDFRAISRPDNLKPKYRRRPTLENFERQQVRFANYPRKCKKKVKNSHFQALFKLHFGLFGEKMVPRRENANARTSQTVNFQAKKFHTVHFGTKMNKIYQNGLILRGSLAKFWKYGRFLQTMALKLVLTTSQLHTQSTLKTDWKVVLSRSAFLLIKD